MKTDVSNRLWRLYTYSRAYDAFDDDDLASTYKTVLNKQLVMSGKGNTSSIISSLAQYFKEAAWTRGNASSWKKDKIAIQNAIMYAVLVVQSFMFFIAYVKRLFYVLILAIMAPVIVAYDFFNKAIS